MFSGALNPMHIIVVLGIALIVFGPKRIPELAKSLGSGVRELKGSLDGHDEAPAPAPAAVTAAVAVPAPVAPTAPAAEPVAVVSEPVGATSVAHPA